MPENHKSLSLSFIFFERKKKASDPAGHKRGAVLFCEWRANVQVN